MDYQPHSTLNTAHTLWTFQIITFGCKVNQYESQSLREAWQQLGGVEVANGTAAQITVVNSCAITARAERETRNALYRLARENPEGQRILTGCAAHLVEATLRDSVQTPPLVHAVLDVAHKQTLLQGPWQALQHTAQSRTAIAPDYPSFSISRYQRARPVLKVQDGCSHRCTYCIVPLARGPATSRKPQEVLAEARRLLLAGHREIMLSGINLAQYGRNTQEYGDFWNLLRFLERELAPEWAGLARFRISSLEPGQLDARGLEVLGTCTMLCPHLHISLQSGSYTVLRRMGRGHYKPQQLLDGIQVLQKHWPRMGLGADILMGFPGEESSHLAETLQLVEALPLSYAHVFPYSRRPGTAAANFADQVTQPEKLQRAALIRSTVQKKQEAFLQAQLELNITYVVPDGVKASKGVNEFYAQCRIVGVPKGYTTAGIIRAKPIGVEKTTLLVSIIPEQAEQV